MATYTFDGTSSLTVTKGDTVFITANPQSFAQATDNGQSVALNYGAATLTITGTTLVAGGLPNVYQSGGQFSYAGSTNSDTPATTGNVLSFLVPTAMPFTLATDSTTANSKVAIFGGLGRSDAADGADSITFGGKGSFLVFGNAGADSITGNAFDSTSTVNVTGGDGIDSITLAGTKASIYVGGGAGAFADSITVSNTGTTFIQGGVDSTDGGDTIRFTGGTGSTSYIYGNGGADSITVSGLDSTSTTTVFGGYGNDSINIAGAKSAITAIGGEGSDTIFVDNGGKGGSIFITGGNPTGGDQSLDLGDSITVIGARTDVAIYGNAGDDTINLTGRTVEATINIYAGKDNDIVNVGLGRGIEQSTVFVAGGEGSDTISIGATDSASAVTVYGGVSASDSADGADVISIGAGAGGTINVYGNGGADSIQVGQLGFDSAHTATIYGGGGADSITVAAQVNGAEALVLTGNENADTFSIAKGTGQTITVSDFTTANSGGDKLALTGLTGANPGNLQVTAPPQGGFQTLQQALDAASNASGGTASQNKAAAVVFSGSTYVVIEQGTAGFQAGTDQAIKLTGVTDLVGLVGQTTLSGTAAQPQKLFVLD